MADEREKKETKMMKPAVVGHHRVIRDIKYHHSPDSNESSSTSSPTTRNDHHRRRLDLQRSIDVYLPIDHSTATTTTTTQTKTKTEADLDDDHLPSCYKPDRLIIYVHGGAWRTGDKADVYSQGLIENLSNRFPRIGICSVNYRLSEIDQDKQEEGSGGRSEGCEKIKHPTHNSDVIEAIESIESLDDGFFDRIQEIYLIGHSVGAFICLSIVGILEEAARPGSRFERSSSASSRVKTTIDGQVSNQVIKPSRIRSNWIIHRIRGLILIDGIYDLVELVREYPSYRDFVSSAFEVEKQTEEEELEYWSRVSPTSWLPSSSSSSSSSSSIPRILIIHSRQDRLLSTHQSELIAHSLHSKLLDSLDGSDKLELDLDSVSGDHDPLLLSSGLIDRIDSFLSI